MPLYMDRHDGQDIYSVLQEFWDNPLVCKECKKTKLDGLNFNSLISIYSEPEKALQEIML